MDDPAQHQHGAAQVTQALVGRLGDEPSDPHQIRSHGLHVRSHPATRDLRSAAPCEGAGDSHRDTVSHGHRRRAARPGHTPEMTEPPWRCARGSPASRGYARLVAPINESPTSTTPLRPPLLRSPLVASAERLVRGPIERECACRERPLISGPTRVGPGSSRGNGAAGRTSRGLRECQRQPGGIPIRRSSVSAGTGTARNGPTVERRWSSPARAATWSSSRPARPRGRGPRGSRTRGADHEWMSTRARGRGTSRGCSALAASSRPSPGIRASLVFWGGQRHAFRMPSSASSSSASPAWACPRRPGQDRCRATVTP